MTGARIEKCCGTLSPRGPERPTQRRECQGSHRTETPPQQLSKQTSAARTRVGALVAYTLHESPHWWVPTRHPRCTGARTTQHATEFLLTVSCNTSNSKSHRSTARVPSSLIPASKELISDSRTSFFRGGDDGGIRGHQVSARRCVIRRTLGRISAHVLPRQRTKLRFVRSLLPNWATFQ